MRSTIALLVLLGAGIGAGFYAAQPAAVATAPGVLAPHAPEQGAAEARLLAERDGYRISSLARFALEARILGREDYRWDRESDLSPTDLALGWGRMSDGAVLSALDITQRNRWYLWRYEGAPPIPRREIERSSANMHIIPASPDVAEALEDARAGMVVSLEGYLVEAEATEDGWRWRSSTTRNDTGDGACELIYVERLELHRRP